MWWWILGGWCDAWKRSCVQAHGQPPAAGKGQETDSPLEPRKEHSPANVLTLAQWSRFWTSDLQSHERLNVCCFKFGDLLQQQWETKTSFSNYTCLCSTILPPPATHNLPSISKRLSFNKRYMSGIIQYVSFWNWFPRPASAKPNSLRGIWVVACISKT